MKTNIDQYINQQMRFHNTCLIPPDPQLVKKLKEEYQKEKMKNEKLTELEFFIKKGYFRYKEFGVDDNLTKDPENSLSRNIELMPRPTFKPRGDVNTLFLLVDFTDKPHTKTLDHFQKLLFSESNADYDNKSLTEYYREASYGDVNVIGYVSDWLRMPRPYSYYVNGKDGMGSYPTNTQKLVEDAIEIAKQTGNINWDLYDLNGDGKIEALSIIHSGRGAEQTGAGNGDIWSHKYQITRKIHVTSQTYALSYLTVPEDARLGVIAHELGHLLFQWPDLYDAEPQREDAKISQGLGSWCLMAGGSWNNDGKTPAYPSAWCRYGQGWAQMNNILEEQELIVNDIEANREVYRLWTNGQDNAEYFILENRQKVKFDKYLHGDGILIFHIDEKAINNWDEEHLGVGIMQADGRKDLQSIFSGNEGDGGDTFPGTSNNLSFDNDSNPNSKSYANKKTGVSVNLLDNQSSKAIKVRVRI